MPNTLTSKQRAALRSMANTLEAIFQVGKGGVTPALTQQLDEALEARELIKGTVLETADVTAKEALEMLAGRLHAVPVQCIGRKIVLYRRSKDKPRIEI